MTDTEYKARLLSGNGGAFLFFGDEDYLRRHWLAQTRKTYIPEGNFFDHIVLNGNDAVSRLAEAISQPPFMADKKLIELHEVNYSSLSDEDTETLVECAREVKAQGDAVLILVALPPELDVGNLPKKPSSIYKKLTEEFEPVNFEHVTAGKLSAWAGRHFAHEKIIAEPLQLDFLVERCGSSMTTLAGEIDKLCAYIKAGGKERLTKEDILFVSCQNVENDTFALSNALLARNKEAAFEALREMKINHVEPIVAVAGITRAYCELAEVMKYAECGLSKAEISSKMSMHSYKVGLCMDAIRRFGEDRIHRAIDLCVKADESVKFVHRDYAAAEHLLSELFG